MADKENERPGRLYLSSKTNKLVAKGIKKSDKSERAKLIENVCAEKINECQHQKKLIEALMKQNDTLKSEATIKQHNVGTKNAEMAKLRRDFVEANISHQRQIELSAEICRKLENEKSDMSAEIDNLAANLETSIKSKLSIEKMYHESQLKQDAFAREIKDLNGICNRLQAGTVEQSRQIEEKEQLVTQLTDTMNTISKQLDELKRSVKEEAKAKSALRELCEQEIESKEELQHSLNKANTELIFAQEAKQKLTVRLENVVETVEIAQSERDALEKTKKLQIIEIDALAVELERANQTILCLDRKQDNFDKILDETIEKQAELQAELEQAENENNFLSTKITKTENEYKLCLETVKCDNKKLQDETSALTDKLVESDKLNYELEKSKRADQIEHNLVKAALEEAEATVESEEAKVIRLQVENDQFKHEMKRIEDEFNDLVIQLGHASRQYAEAQAVCSDMNSTIKTVQNQNMELQSRLEQAESNCKLMESNYEEEKTELSSLLTKINIEIVEWRTKCETETVKHTEEFEEAERMLADVEKEKDQQKTEIEDLTLELDRAIEVIKCLRTKQRNFDKILAEAMQKDEQEKLQLLQMVQDLSGEFQAVSWANSITRRVTDEILDKIRSVTKDF